MTTTTEVARLQYRLEATTDRLETQLKRAQRTMRRSSRSMERDVSRLDRSVMALGTRFGALLPAVTVAAITAGANRVLSSLDEIGKTSTRLGLTAESLQELRSAAEQSGVASNTLDMALQRMQRRVAEAREGTGEAKAALEEMGIALNNTSGEARPLEEILSDVADRLSETEDAGTRTRLAFKLFDSEGVSLIQMLGKGSKALEAMRDRARDLGNVIDNETVKEAEILRTEIDLLSNTITTRFTKAVGIGARALNEFFNIGNRGRISELDTTINDVGTSIERVSGEIEAGRGDPAQLASIIRNLKQSKFDAIAERQALSGEMFNGSAFEPVTLPAATGAPGGASGGGSGGSGGGTGGGGGITSGNARQVVDIQKQLIERAKEHAAAVEEQIAAVGKSGLALDRLRNKQEASRLEQQLLTDAKRMEIALTPELREEITRLSDEYQKQLDTLTTMKTAHEGMVEATKAQKEAAAEATRENQAMAQSIAQIGIQATSVKDAVTGLLTELLRVSAGGFFDGLFASSGSGGGASLGGFFKELGASVLTGAFANGTNNAPGGLALVGERGPEVVNLPRGSQVIPNHRIGGMSAGGGVAPVKVVVNNNAKADVSVSESTSGSGREIQVAIEETVAASIGRPRSKLNTALDGRNRVVRR